MGGNSKEMMLDSCFHTISDILKEVSEIGDFSQKAERLDFYVHLMEEELKTIDAFKRDLPHCMYLLKDGGEFAARGQKMGPVTKELISIKSDSKGKNGAGGSNDINDKKSWMSSVDLTNTLVQYENNFCIANQGSLLHLGPIRHREEEGSGSASHFNVCNFKSRGGAFVPYKKPSVMEKEERVLPFGGPSLTIPAVEIESDDSSAKEGCGFVKSNLQQPHQKKQRRCWSPELHERFLGALEQLGGAQSATPKQIRDFMKVDGLTNNEVKSHLQKFRLHIRETPTSSYARVVDYSTLAPNACSNMSRPMGEHSDSPPGPFPRGGGANKGGSTSGGGSMEDEEDDKPESQNWKGRFQKNVEKRL